MKVCKFGGSSLADGQQFKKVIDIILQDDQRNVIVVSALGKKDSEDNKITDLLYLTVAHIRYGVKYHDLFDAIINRFKEVITYLNLSNKVMDELMQLKDELPILDEDTIISKGETFTSKILAEALGYRWIDAKDLFFFNYDGSFNQEKSFLTIQSIISKNDKVVIPGFYGCLPNGKIKLMKRGGSDISGAYLASALQAELYENWTDVSGIYMANPKIINNPQPIATISISELREMAYMGATVVHEDAIAPLLNTKIALNIKNTNHPEHPGTLIKDEVIETSDTDRFITGIAGKKAATIVTLFKKNVSKDTTSLQKAMQIFDILKIQVQHLSLGIDSITIVSTTDQLHERQNDLLAELEKLTLFDTIRLEENIAIIAAVGRRMRDRAGISGQLFQALGQQNINIRMITQGTDEISIIVGVSDADYEAAIKVLYERFTS